MSQEVTLTMDGMLLNWLKDAGDSVSSGEIIAEVEADKATVEVEAPADGVLLELRAAVGEEINEGSVIAVVGEAGESSAPPAEATKEEAGSESGAEQEQPAKSEESAESAEPTTSTTENGRIKASPLARNLAEDKGIDLAQVRGSGPNGRIIKKDVEGFDPASAKPASAPVVSAPLSGQQTYGAVPTGDDVEILEVNRMRRAIADSTILSMQMTPHFYVASEVDVDALLALRKQINESLAADGIKVSVNDLVVKATAIALKSFPNLNTHYYGDKLVRHKLINVGIAVALPNNGLMNVVSHNADETPLSVMAVEHKEMFERAREGKIKPTDIRGATFTVSNLGPYDVDFFAAIISPPEAGILAVSTAKKVPVVLEDGTLGVGTRMKVMISVDHRVSDGAEGAQYLQLFKSLIENPMRLLI